MSAGRPRKFKSVEEMKDKIDSYFAPDNHPWTVSGLCIHLGILRDTLIEYGLLEEFSDTVKEAKMKIENYAENILFQDRNVTGVIFNLKNNFGWRDKQEIESKNENTNVNTDITTLSPDERKRRINELLNKINT